MIETDITTFLPFLRPPNIDEKRPWDIEEADCTDAVVEKLQTKFAGTWFVLERQGKTVLERSQFCKYFELWYQNEFWRTPNPKFSYHQVFFYNHEAAFHSNHHRFRELFLKSGLRFEPDTFWTRRTVLADMPDGRFVRILFWHDQEQVYNTVERKWPKSFEEDVNACYDELRKSVRRTYILPLMTRRPYRA